VVEPHACTTVRNKGHNKGGAGSAREARARTGVTLAPKAQCCPCVASGATDPSANHPQPTENTMPKGQRSGKEAKKPKKDQPAGKPISPDAVSPTRVTVVPDRSKKK